MKNWYDVLDLIVKELSVAHMMGKTLIIFMYLMYDKYLNISLAYDVFIVYISNYTVYGIIIKKMYIYRKIKVWNLVAALDPRAPASTLCLRTLMVSVLHYIHIYDLLFFRD